MKCTEANFLKDIAGHQMKVLSDTGVHRYIRCQKPGTWCFGFHIITWPGALCIDGDMGTFVFRRLDDMFEFFRTDRREGKPGKQLYINKGYWAEKCVSDSRYKGLQEFDPDLFRENVVRRYKDWLESRRDEFSAAVRRDLREQLRNDVLGAADEGKHNAITAALEFRHKETRFNLDDFYECNTRSYTFHFVWCLYAIAWAIKQYDETKATADCHV